MLLRWCCAASAFDYFHCARVVDGLRIVVGGAGAGAVAGAGNIIAIRGIEKNKLTGFSCGRIFSFRFFPSFLQQNTLCYPKWAMDLIVCWFPCAILIHYAVNKTVSRLAFWVEFYFQIETYLCWFGTILKSFSHLAFPRTRPTRRSIFHLIFASLIFFFCLFQTKFSCFLFSYFVVDVCVLFSNWFVLFCCLQDACEDKCECVGKDTFHELPVTSGMTFGTHASNEPRIWTVLNFLTFIDF